MRKLSSLRRGVLTMVSIIASLAASMTGAPRAAEFPAGSVSIDDPWSPPTPPGATVGVVYLSITNRGATADRLIALSTPAARSAEIHETRSQNGMMTMRPLESLECPPHATVKVEPGGVHIMLVGLAAPLAAGSDLPLTLRFAHAGEVGVRVHVGARE